jgi:hypothetical protein
MRDLPAILYYAGSSWLDSVLRAQLQSSFPNSNMTDYVADGVIGTLNQDYLINLIGQEGVLPKAMNDSSGVMSTGFNY